jgi:biotin carboxyl carrier protein
MTDPEPLSELNVDGAVYRTRLTPRWRARRPFEPSDPREVRARIPGTIREVHVAPGRRVERGEALLVLEAMKMRNSVTAPLAGTVEEVRVEPGMLVAKNELLLRLTHSP